MTMQAAFIEPYCTVVLLKRYIAAPLVKLETEADAVTAVPSATLIDATPLPPVPGVTRESTFCAPEIALPHVAVLWVAQTGLLAEVSCKRLPLFDRTETSVSVAIPVPGADMTDKIAVGHPELSSWKE